MRDRLRTAAVSLLVGTALLSGCSQPQQASTTLPSAAPTPTAEELPPLGPPDLPMPAEAREQTPEGAEAFARYYIDLYNHALRSLDTSHLDELSTGCETCGLLSQQIDAVAAERREYSGGEVRVDAITEPAIQGTEAQFAFSITQAPLAVTQDGEQVQERSYPERPSPASGGILAWDDGRTTWLMTRLDVQ